MDIINLNDNLKENLYYIGGIVRDMVLNRKSKDIDITFVGDAIKFCRSLPEGEILQENSEFGTCRMVLQGKVIDFASTRAETYPRAGHLPVVTSIGGTLKDDVLRRDFTINALAKSLKTGEIIDYTGGLNDIKSRKIRVLHNKSFIDDPSRILRALKFRIRFDFDLEENTKKLQEQYLQNVNYDMSYKRLKKELVDTFELNSQKAFEIFIEEKMYKLLSNDTPLRDNFANFEELVNKYKSDVKSPWIVYAGALSDLKALPLTKFEQKVIDKARALSCARLTNDFEIYKSFEGVPIESLLIFASENQQAVTRYLDTLRHIKLAVTGEDIKALGYEPSEKFSDCFDYILEKKLTIPTLTKPDEIDLIKRFFVLV